jgi:hypothetical protein
MTLAEKLVMAQWILAVATGIYVVLGVIALRVEYRKRHKR